MDEVLYILVFGESLLNDAVTVVVYQMMHNFGEIGQDRLEIKHYLSAFANFLGIFLVICRPYLNTCQLKMSECPDFEIFITKLLQICRRLRLKQKFLSKTVCILRFFEKKIFFFPNQ